MYQKYGAHMKTSVISHCMKLYPQGVIPLLLLAVGWAAVLCGSP